jgi:capsule polysaccharide export protein KpsE/RkpR
LIAAQSQLEGLRQIYTDNNARVRSMNARVAELRRQLEKLGGAQGNAAKNRPAPSLAKSQAADPPASPSTAQTADPPAGQDADQLAVQPGVMPYPTIHSLPLLGAKYADHYRRAKIQETVYELLTQQYELAKVQEAKETPSVKILDPATIPEKKSFPPRLLIMLLGTFLAMTLSVVWVLGSNQWQQADPDDPRKILAQEVAATLKARAHWFSRNGSSAGAEEKRVLGRRDDRSLAGGSEER